MSESPSVPAYLPPRHFSMVNWLGFWTLLSREIRRFMRVYFQTLLSPVVTTLLFLVVFGVAMGRTGTAVDGVPFLEFLTPGLMMMALMQNAFANTSSSLIIAKVQGNIIDILMPPLSAGEITVAMTLGGIVRGVLVGLCVWLAVVPFVEVKIYALWAIVYYAVMGAMLMALLGMVGGIWADKFDHMAAVTNFVITPLTFLSGTFYSVQRLPESVQIFAHFNPFFHIIDGFRYGFTGHIDGGTPWIGSLVLLGLNTLLLAVVWLMIARGYKLKS